MSDVNLYDLFRKQEEQEEAQAAWLASALTSLEAPSSLKERNWKQLMLADRFSQQFRTSKLEAMEQIAPKFAEQFPN